MKRLALSISAFVALALAFAFTFDGAPSAPLPFAQSADAPSFDVQIHKRDMRNMDPMDAQHGADCSAPPATHPVTGWQDSVFICNNHMMTAINGGDYGVIYFAPNVLADFSAGETVIKWDMSTARTSDRDWVDLWIQPMDSFIPLPLDINTDLQGPPKEAFQLFMGVNTPCSTFSAHSRIYSGYSQVSEGDFWMPCPDVFGTPSATRRDTFELHLTRTSAYLRLPAYNWISPTITFAPLPFDKGIVQFGHHSYSPDKGWNLVTGTFPGSPNTWHWDNVEISPSLPVTMIKGDKGLVFNEGTYTLSAPAPANAFLAFGAECQVSLSFDGGPYQSFTREPQAFDHPEHVSNYHVSIPAGTTTIAINLTGTFRETGCWSEAMTVWAPGGGGGAPSPTATATQPAPTATPTSVPPTATNTVAPPTATATPVPPTATATATARYRCQVWRSGRWVTVWDRTGGGSCP